MRDMHRQAFKEKAYELSGATIPGNGGVALILDLPQLAQSAQAEAEAEAV
jgi:chemotaxis protein histidine kinase CheA